MLPKQRQANGKVNSKKASHAKAARARGMHSTARRALDEYTSLTHPYAYAPQIVKTGMPPKK